MTEPNIHIVSTQDTDVAPFDLGAYASRQTYVSGTAVKRAGELLRQKIVEYAAIKLKKPAEELDVEAGSRGAPHQPAKADAAGGAGAGSAVQPRARENALFAEVHVDMHENTIATGCTFAEVEVDIPLGKVTVLSMLNVHDSGILINPKLAEGQVQGGMSMGIGYALFEELLL